MGCSGNGEGVMVAGIAVELEIIAVRVNVGEAGINSAVGVVTEGLHAQTPSNRIVEASRLNLLIRLTLISIPLTLQFEFTFQPVCQLGRVNSFNISSASCLPP